MSRNVHTIIFVPHARARFRKLQVSSRMLAALGIAVGALCLLGIASTALWIGSLRHRQDAHALASENQSLRSRAKLLNERLSTIEKQLGEFEEKTRRLSIVAGLSTIRDPGTGGVGGALLAVTNDDSLENGLAAADRRGTLLSSRLHLVERRLALQADQLAFTPTLAPAAGVLTAGFGTRSDPFTEKDEFHTGIDISTPSGNRVFAPANGTVVKVSWETGYGRVLEIAHGYGLTTLYGHLEASRVREGQRVHRGDLIALVGTSGRSTGPHLHYEVHVAGKAVNPLDYILNEF